MIRTEFMATGTADLALRGSSDDFARPLMSLFLRAGDIALI